MSDPPTDGPPGPDAPEPPRAARRRRTAAKAPPVEAPAPQQEAPVPAPEPAVSPELLAAAARWLAPPDLVDEDEEDPTGGGMAFVRSGVIRLTVGEDTYRLRRPSFGQLRELRLAFQDVEWELEDTQDEARELADRLRADAGKIDRGDPDRRDRVAAIRAESRAAARKHEEATDAAYLRWWRLAFEMLTDAEPPADDDMPSWLVDHRLVNQVLHHWRTVPLGRGASNSQQP